MPTVDRRSFLSRSARVAAGGALIPASLSGLLAACTEADPAGVLVPRMTPLASASRGRGGYGDPLPGTGILLLPEDFQVAAFGVVGEMMSDGNVDAACT
ncbi:MAG: hypothetical protein ACREOG_00395 [Gemmatimonadaceae bacterium]